MNDIIRGEYFRGLENIKCNVFYKDTHDVNSFLKNPPKSKFILISHNSDGAVTRNPKKYDADFNLTPTNLKHWFAQNVEVDDPRITSLPIGLENFMWFKDRKIKSMKNILTTKKNINNLLYVCHNINTYPKERKEPYELFKNKSWATVVNGRNGNGFDDYIKKIHNHKFVLCPRGNGVDTVRLWECLYMNTIPIVMNNFNVKYFKDLPILIVDDWKEITEKRLNDTYTLYNNKQWNKEKLNFSFWKNKIIQEADLGE
jgi:hypothetical protein